MKPNFIIFTDGSVRQWKERGSSDKMTVAGYGVVIIDMTTQKYTSFGGPIRTTSIPFAEAWAAYRGLQFMNGICKKQVIKPKAVIISDNKGVVSTFTEYIPYCWDISDWKHWKRVDGSSVKNQEVFRSILTLMSDNGMRVKFAHINSHVKQENWEAISKKLNYAGITCSEHISKLFLDMNSLADKTASDITFNLKIAKGEDLVFEKKKLNWTRIGDREK